jgi:glycosyltransferase involved in cell wall biosynthesis
MKVLLIYYEPQLSGQTTHVLSLARSLGPRRHDLTIVLPEHLIAAVRAFQQTGACVVPLPLRKILWPPRAITTLIRLIRDTQPDIVHIHSQEAGLIARPIARLATVRSIVYTPQTIDIRRTRWQWLYARLESTLACLTSAIVSVNDVDRQRLIQWGVPVCKVVAIPNGIDLTGSDRLVEAGALHQLPDADMDITLSPSSCRTTVRQGPAQTGPTGDQPESPLILQVGRLSTQKDPLTFVEGAAHVLSDHPQAQFALLGDGPLREDVSARIRELGLEHRVHLLGWRPNAHQLMVTASVVTLTSRWEGAPYALLEAMASSRPVVATAVNGCPEIVVEGQTGYLVSPNDPDAWATAVGTLLDDPTQAVAMGRRGRERVTECFALPQMIARIERLYESVAFPAPT